MKKMFLTLALLFSMAAGAFAVDEAAVNKAFESFFSDSSAKYMKLKLNVDGDAGTFIFRANSVTAGGAGGGSIMVNVTNLADDELSTILFKYVKLEKVNSISYANGILYLDVSIDK